VNYPSESDSAANSSQPEPNYSDNPDRVKDDFLYPRSKYRGEFSPQNLAFDTNLQEFAQRISLICALENSGKLAPEDAYLQIKDLWKSLKRSKQNLLDLDPPDLSS
jgi:hypothetical protein